MVLTTVEMFVLVFLLAWGLLISAKMLRGKAWVRKVFQYGQAEDVLFDGDPYRTAVPGLPDDPKAKTGKAAAASPMVIMPPFTKRCPLCGFKLVVNQVCGQGDSKVSGCDLGAEHGPHVHHLCDVRAFDVAPFAKTHGCGARWVSRAPWNPGKKS